MVHGVDWNTWASVVTIIGFITTVVLPAIRRWIVNTMEKHSQRMSSEIDALSQKLDDHINRDHGGVYRGRRTY